MKADQQHSKESLHVLGRLQSEICSCRIKELEAVKTFSFIFANGLIDLILTVSATEGNQYITHKPYSILQMLTTYTLL